MPKDYALRKLYSKEKVIICGCDAISGLLIHHQLDELFGRCEYKILHQYDLQLQKDWEWNTDEPIPDKDIIKEWFFEEPERIITTCWDYERTLKAVYDARITNVRIYKFCEYNRLTILMLLVPLSTQVIADDPIEERQTAKEKYLPYKLPRIEPITTVKAYVRGNIRYWEEYTPDGIIVRISSREITHSAGV